MSEIIKVEGLNKIFKNGTEKDEPVIALEDIAFSIDNPTILSVLGANGAGKSTLIKILLGLISPSSGSVSVIGYEPYQKNHIFLKNIGFVSGQRRALNSDLPGYVSIHSNALFYGLDKEEIEKRIKFYSQLFSIENKIKQPVRTLSLGETIKMEIVNSIIHKPKVLFLDEPSIGLDFDSHEKIIELLKKIHEEDQITIVLTSHYMRDIKELSKKTLVIENGKQLFFGDFKDLNANTSFSGYLDSLNKEILKYS